MSHQTLIWMSACVGLLFVFAFGAIVGSFLNVVIIRLPEGRGIVRPPSSCPACGTVLRWHDNIPIVGWLLLRGRCKYCRTKISPQYVLIELLVALLFAGIYAMWLMRPSLFPAEWAAALSPEWARLGLARMWPMFLTTLLLVAALIAITIIDARTFLIPLLIPVSVTTLALIAHPFNAWLVSRSRAVDLLGPPRTPSDWTIPLPDAGALGVALGASAGIAVSMALLRARIMPQSFADYEAWENEAEAQARAATSEGAPSEQDVPIAEGGDSFAALLTRTFLLTGPALALMLVGMLLGARVGQAQVGVVIGSVVGLLIGVCLRALAGRRDAGDDEPIWLGYPHARREMGKEILFLLPAVGLGTLGYVLATGPLASLAADPHLAVRALAGSLLGYLVGGGVVWAVRILGSLAFGKEAMGLGDVHLMAMVGAVQGWIDPLLAFFVAPFLGILWAVATVVFRRFLRSAGTALPFGPHLAIATLMVILAKPLFEIILGGVVGRTIDLP